MAQAPKRTRPLDRDGDGKDGGSLPGNKTAPMAKDAAPADPVDDLADARTTPGDSPEKLEAIERETDEANAAARAGDTGTEDCQECLEEFSTGTLEDGYCISCVINRETDTVSDNVADALNAIAEVEPELVAQVTEDHGGDAYTFDAEQVEAGLIARRAEQAALLINHLVLGEPLLKGEAGYGINGLPPFLPFSATETPINAGHLQVVDDSLIITPEGVEPFTNNLKMLLEEAVIDAAKPALPLTTSAPEQVEDTPAPQTTQGQVEAGQVIDASDPAAPASAYRMTELQTLADSRFLYKSAQGYSPTYAAPFISEAVAQQMIKDGLATFDAQAGNSGALRPTAKARPFAAQIARNFDEARNEEASA